MTDIMIRPKCECHGVEMYFHKRAKAPKGGYWECKIKVLSQPNKKSNKRKQYSKEYERSEAGRRRRRKHQQTDKYKAERKIRNKKNKEKIKKQKRAWWDALSEEQKQLKLDKFKLAMEKKNEDLMYRLKQDAKQWQKDFRRATYL